MVTISSTSDATTEQTAAAFKEKGIALVPSPATAVAEPPADPAVDPNKPSETPAPGGEAPAEPVVEIAPATEEGKDKQEPPPAAGDEPVVVEPAKPKAKGGFQVKIDKLTAQLENARADKTKTLEEVEVLRAELAQLKATGSPAAEPAKVETGPVKPKRPTLAECDGDYDKYEAAMEEYDGKLSVFHQEISAKTAKDAIAAERADREENTRKEAQKVAFDSFVDRRTKGAAEFEDFQDVVDSVPEGSPDIMASSQIAHDFILFKSKEPAALIYALAKDMVENGGELNTRLKGMDAYDVVLELKAMGDEYAAKRGPAKPAVVTPKVTATAPAAAAAPVPAEVPVVRQPAQPPPNRPIAPLGGRGASPITTDTLAAATQRGDMKAYRKLREAGVKA